MARTLALSRLAVILPIVAVLLAACGGSDTIFDDASVSGGTGGVGTGGMGGATPDGAGGVGTISDASLESALIDARAEGDSSRDGTSSDVRTDADAATADARADADARVDATADVSANVDGRVDADATVADVRADADASVDADAGVNTVTDASLFSILGSATTFAVLAGQAVNNTLSTVVNGDLGVFPLTTVTGSPLVLGTSHLGDGIAGTAQNDLTTAYNLLAGKACGTALTGQELGGLTLPPGVYCFTSGAHLGGTLFLDPLAPPFVGDAQSDAPSDAQSDGPIDTRSDAQIGSDRVWIFQIASTLGTDNGAQIVMLNGASPCDVYWQVGSSATLGNANLFSGNILALADITVQLGTTVTGRVLSQAAGTVNLASNVISNAICPGAPAIDAGARDAEAGAPDADAGPSD